MKNGFIFNNSKQLVSGLYSIVRHATTKLVFIMVYQMDNSCKHHTIMVSLRMVQAGPGQAVSDNC
ncbi:hypothetical protein DPMN_015738 [Dreissena polymorpha]|uniref:Uncharacterized protein n=1 Tax=Dreissena polymorpha TaxID=45954 RepID=A0A9D4N8C0_DREPO|nr:hypothetical protein DPMN_015738 [Dreissena polymorpha]